MDLKKMYYFTRVAAHLSFSKAAEECFIAQTAMSRHIAGLEAELGFPLLVRGPHKVELTPAGKYYLEECNRILNAVGRARQTGSQISEGIVDSLTVGFGGFEVSLVKKFAREFRKRYPMYTVLLQEYSYDQLLPALLMQKCDVIFSTELWVEQAGAVQHRVIGSANYSVLCGSHEPFFRNEALTVPELNGRNFIFSKVDTPDGLHGEMFHNDCAAMGLQAGQLIFTNSVAAVASMIQLGAGVCLISEAYTEDLGQDLRNIPILCDNLPRKTHIAACRGNDPKPSVRLFMDTVDG